MSTSKSKDWIRRYSFGVRAHRWRGATKNWSQKNFPIMKLCQNRIEKETKEDLHWTPWISMFRNSRREMNPENRNVRHLVVDLQVAQKTVVSFIAAVSAILLERSRL